MAKKKVEKELSIEEILQQEKERGLDHLAYTSLRNKGGRKFLVF
jgi:hypothetical protein